MIIKCKKCGKNPRSGRSPFCEECIRGTGTGGGATYSPTSNDSYTSPSYDIPGHDAGIVGGAYDAATGGDCGGGDGGVGGGD